MDHTTLVNYQVHISSAFEVVMYMYTCTMWNTDIAG